MLLKSFMRLKLADFYVYILEPFCDKVFAKNPNINVGQNHSLFHEQMLLDKLIGHFVKGKATGVVPRAAVSVNGHSFPVTVVFTE